MLIQYNDLVKLIESGVVLHIAGAEDLLKKLPKGNWIGGSTEYFMAKSGGKVSDELLYVTEFKYNIFNIKTYDSAQIKNIAKDAYNNGLSILIIPFDSAVHREYAEYATEYEDMFMKPIVGWISGLNLNKQGQTPIAINGFTGEICKDTAVCLHIKIPSDKMATVNIINIFEVDENSPLITFKDNGFSIKTCLVDGEETDFAEYITKNNLNTKLPLIGNYSGMGINVSYRGIENGVVQTYAPVFNNIEYRFAKNIPDYTAAFHEQLKGIDDTNALFSCNCILNFLYGELESKSIEAFGGPITFGEIAYQLVNQTLVYVTV